MGIKMRNFLILVVLFATNSLLAQDLIILHTNDIHNHINGLAPETEFTPLVNDNDTTLGGFSRIAGFIKAEKEKNGDKLLVVDCGDFSMGTLFQTLESDEGFQLNLMKRIGYEYVGLGNHEFDYGANKLANIISLNQKLGGIPQLLNSNYIKANDGSDSDLVKKIDEGCIQPYKIVEKNGFKIGIFSVVGEAANNAIPNYFNVKFRNARKVAVKTARFLKQKERVDLVVVLSHSGVRKNEKGEWQGEDVELGEASPDIDIIISGHTHTFLSELVKAGNAVVVQTGRYGYNVGKLDVTFDKNKKPLIHYQLVPMNDHIVADSSIQKYIDEKAVVVEKNILSDFDVKFYEPLFESSFNLVKDEKEPEKSNLGSFVSDAIDHYLNVSNHEGVDIAVVAKGVIRHNIDLGKTGKQNINDIYNIVPLGMSEEKNPGSPLCKVYLSGNELKKVFELILFAYPRKSSFYFYFTGLQLTYNPDKRLFRKISEIKIGNETKGYRSVSFSKKDRTLYCIAANKYSMSFIAKLKRMSFGTFNVIAKNKDGSVIKNDNFLIDLDKNKEGIQEAKEWLAILDYIRSFPDLNGNGLPDIPEIYKTKVNSITIKN
jgi:5'-nucleotidase / UDP-sugar diphosphatase